MPVGKKIVRKRRKQKRGEGVFKVENLTQLRLLAAALVASQGLAIAQLPHAPTVVRMSATMATMQAMSAGMRRSAIQSATAQVLVATTSAGASSSPEVEKSGRGEKISPP